MLKKFDEMHKEDARLRKKMFDENKKLHKMLTILHKRQKAAKKAASKKKKAKVSESAGSAKGN